MILQDASAGHSEELETPRLRLRATRAGAGGAVKEALLESLGELRPWMPWAREAQVLEDAEKHCREMQARWHARQELDFTFLRKDDGLLVGKGGLHTIDWTVPKLEIGYWVRTSCARQGFASEAAAALATFARDRLGSHRLEITSDTRNVPSRKVAEKCGFTLEGILRQSRRGASGELADSCVYARTFPEWRDRILGIDPGWGSRAMAWSRRTAPCSPTWRAAALSPTRSNPSRGASRRSSRAGRGDPRLCAVESPWRRCSST